MSAIFLLSQRKYGELAANSQLFPTWTSALGYTQFYILHPELSNFQPTLDYLPGASLIYVPDQTVFEGAQLQEVQSPYGPRRVWAMVDPPYYQKTLDAARKVAEVEHKKAYPEIVKQAKRLGYTQQQVDQVFKFIRDEVPIVIHFPVSRLAGMVKDTHLRNVFEIYGNDPSWQKMAAPRIAAQGRLFGESYNQCPPSEKCKYGALNLTLNPKGIEGCATYGRAYMVLKPHVRSRTTTCYGDSFGIKKVGTLEYFAHSLGPYMNDNEFKTIFNIALKRSPGGGQGLLDKFMAYREVQIHGPVRFDTDIESIVLPAQDKADQWVVGLAEQFARKNHVKLIWA